MRHNRKKTSPESPLLCLSPLPHCLVGARKINSSLSYSFYSSLLPHRHLTSAFLAGPPGPELLGVGRPRGVGRPGVAGWGGVVPVTISIHPHQPFLSAFVSSGCCNKVPQPRWLINHRHLFLKVLDAGSPRLECQCGRVLAKALFQFAN